VRARRGPISVRRAANDVEVVPFQPGFASGVVDLIVGIQRGEFAIDITAEQQPDLLDIPGFYQAHSGNFWVAIAGGRSVGTIALLDIGSQQAALRKLFVHRDFRGPALGTAKRLLDTLLEWARDREIREIFLGTTARFLAAHRFYEKNGFTEIMRSALPPAFPIMTVDVKFYRRSSDPLPELTAGGDAPILRGTRLIGGAKAR
jgi:GNAT superfamily N-acetyltransferase